VGLKIAVIGGASVYTPELVEGFLERKDELPLGELCLMDIDPARLQIVGRFAERMVQAKGGAFRVTLASRREEALAGADFVIAQIRVGGMTARALDERIPPQFGVVGQETTGPGGFAKALRTIPVMLELAHAMGKLCPNTFLINFTNPSGVVTEALLRYSNVRVLGLCNIPTGFKYTFATWLQVDPSEIELDYVGLNHLGWVRGVRCAGEDVFSKVFAEALDRARRGELPFSPDLLEILGMIPSYYLRYYYHHDEVLAEQRAAGKTRAEEVQAIDAELLRMYADPALVRKPELLGKRGGAYYSTAAVTLISAIYNDKREVHIVNVRNDGAIPDLSADAVVEVPALVDREGAHPLPCGPLPPQIRGLVQALKSYEELTVEAAVTGDERRTIQALLAHPLVPSFAVAQGLWKALKEAHRPYLPQFFRAP
jgi:6-phospho-beta-glucosidase